MDREAFRIISERSAEASSAATGGDIISIRLRRVILLRRDIRLTPGDITLRAVLEANKLFFAALPRRRKAQLRLAEEQILLIFSAEIKRRSFPERI